MDASTRRNGADAPVDAVRAFNRFYTRRIGLLDSDLHGSRHSLPEVRILYELATVPARGASEVARALHLDIGYVSRLVKKLHAQGLVRKTPSPTDGRQSLLALTGPGKKIFAPIERATREQIDAMLSDVPSDRRDVLLRSMRTIRRILDDGGDPADGGGPVPRALVVREPRVGDIGWIVHRQAVLYADEYGWDATFEGLLAEIAGSFVKRFDPAFERCWVAELDGEVAGAVFVVRKTARVAQLRMLFVEPSARGRGIGALLVDECVAFARAKRYRRMVLWTNDVLVSARRLYEAAGFRLASQEHHHSFGRDLVGQSWSLAL